MRAAGLVASFTWSTLMLSHTSHSGSGFGLSALRLSARLSQGPFWFGNKKNTSPYLFRGLDRSGTWMKNWPLSASAIEEREGFGRVFGFGTAGMVQFAPFLHVSHVRSLRSFSSKPLGTEKLRKPPKLPKTQGRNREL